MYARRKQYALEYLGGVCQECGTNNDLQIDHITPRAKHFDLLGPKWSCQWQRWHDELEKCQLLCHDCHVDKTNADRASTPPTYSDEPPF